MLPRELKKVSMESRLTEGVPVQVQKDLKAIMVPLSVDGIIPSPQPL